MRCSNRQWCMWVLVGSRLAESSKQPASNSLRSYSLTLYYQHTSQMVQIAARMTRRLLAAPLPHEPPRPLLVRPGTLQTACLPQSGAGGLLAGRVLQLQQRVCHRPRFYRQLRGGPARSVSLGTPPVHAKDNTGKGDISARGGEVPRGHGIT